MRRRRRLRWTDLPRLLVGAVVQFANLFGGRYHRTEGAHVLVTDAGGRILVVRTTYLGPEWMLPGGRVERGETPHAGAVRETEEETGVRAHVERLLLVDARRGQNVSFIFGGRLLGGELAPQLGEIAEAAWLHRDEIARESPSLHRLLAAIDEGGGDERVVYLGMLPA